MICLETVAARHRRMLAWRARCRRLFAAAGGAVNRASRLCDRYFAAYFAACRAVLDEAGRKAMDDAEREDFMSGGWVEHGGN